MKAASTRSAPIATTRRCVGGPTAAVRRSTGTPRRLRTAGGRKAGCGDGFEGAPVGAAMHFFSYRALSSRLGRIQRMSPDNWPVPTPQEGGRVAKGSPLSTKAGGVTGSDDGSRSITGATVAGGEGGSSQAQPGTHFGTEMTRNR